jgi:hypothetical protein
MTGSVASRSAGSDDRQFGPAFEAAASAATMAPYYAVGTVRNAGLAVQNAIGSHSPFWNFFAASRLFSIVRVPMDLYNMHTAIAEGANSTEKDDKVDAVLSVFTTLGDIADATATFASGLGAVGAIAELSLLWVQPLFIVSIPLQAAGLLASTIGLYRTYNCVNGLEKDLKTGGHVNVMNTLMDQTDGYFKRNFKVSNGMQLKADIKKLLASDKVTSEEKEAKMKTLFEDLKGRASQRMKSHALSILVTTISLIAMALFFFSPLAPVAFGMAAVATFGALLVFAYEYRNRKHPLVRMESEG